MKGEKENSSKEDRPGKGYVERKGGGVLISGREKEIDERLGWVGKARPTISGEKAEEGNFTGEKGSHSLQRGRGDVYYRKSGGRGKSSTVPKRKRESS